MREMNPPTGTQQFFLPVKILSVISFVNLLTGYMDVSMITI